MIASWVTPCQGAGPCDGRHADEKCLKRASAAARFGMDILMKPIISLKDIHKSFGDTPVLRGVDLAASQSEIVAIIGSSGSGKSTLLRCINLLEVPEAGSIEIAGARRLRFQESSAPGSRQSADPRQVQGCARGWAWFSIL